MKIDIAGMKHGKLVAIRHCGHGNQLTRCECGAEVVVNTANFKRGLAAKNCGRIECLPLEPGKYRRRLIRHVARARAEQALWESIDKAIAQIPKCKCRRNKYYCKSCAALIDKFQSIGAAGEWVGRDSLFDREHEPAEPREVEPPEPEMTQAELSASGFAQTFLGG